MSLINYNSPLFPRWNNFFEGVSPDDRFLSFENKFNPIPATNIEDKDSEFVISMAVPGVEKEDINVEVHENVITISSEKEESSEATEKSYSRKEYSYNSFKRTFRLPQNIQEDKIEANYENGELILQLPKLKPEVTKVKKIKVA
jgi:HSP20 family protein